VSGARLHKPVLVRATVQAFGEEFAADAWQCSVCGLLQLKPHEGVFDGDRCHGIRLRDAFPPARKAAKR